MRYIFLVSHFDRLYPGQYVCKTDFLLAIITGTCHLWSIEWKCDRILIWMWLCAFCSAYLACWVERQWDHYFLLKRSLCLWPIHPTMGLFKKVVYRLKHNAVLWMPIFFFFFAIFQWRWCQVRCWCHCGNGFIIYLYTAFVWNCLISCPLSR